MADDVADRILAGSREGVQDPERGHEPSRQKRRVPTGAGPGRAEHDQGVSVFAYDADGPEVFGLGPGLTVLMGLPPPTPSAMAFRMSTSTTILVPTTRTLTPFIFRLLRAVVASKFSKATESGQTEIPR
jgi:hypothetical protein